jgi:hypothetical protein
MDTNQKNVKGSDRPTNQVKDDKNKNMPEKKPTEFTSDDKKGDMKRVGDKKPMTTNKK